MQILCATCGESIEMQSDDGACPECEASYLLDGRYRVEARMGRGAAGISYRGERVEDGRAVAIKRLSYSAMDSMKMQDLFEREARVLRQLDHPRIPSYVDDFSVQTDDRISLYVVQDFIDGRTLEAEMEQRRYDEAEILEILEALVEVLVYLQDLRPPVIHRDIKPTNVMRRSDGELVLIDFGSVKATTDGAVGGSTVAGTFGYMAPEQNWGRATLQTDLYGVGALGLALLSRREPASFVGDNHQLQWRDQVEASEPVKDLLDDLLAADLGERVEDAEAARAAIERARRRLERGDEQPATYESAAEPTEPEAAAERTPPPEDEDDTPISAPTGLPDEEASGALRNLLIVVGLCLAGGVTAIAIIAGESGEDGYINFSGQACSGEDCRSLQTSYVGDLDRSMRYWDVAKQFESVEETGSKSTFIWETEVLGQSVQCTGHFGGTGDFLRGLTCRGDGPGDGHSFDRAMHAVLRDLASHYGKPTRFNPPDVEEELSAVEDRKGAWTWEEGGARLEFSFEFDPAEVMADKTIDEVIGGAFDDQKDLVTDGRGFIIEQQFGD